MTVALSALTHAIPRGTYCERAAAACLTVRAGMRGGRGARRSGPACRAHAATIREKEGTAVKRRAGDDGQKQGRGSRRALSRRQFLVTAGAVGTASEALGPALAAAQAPKGATKETLRPVVDAADLAITDEQLGKLAGAVTWARGELEKLREVDTGIGGPTNQYVPPAFGEPRRP